MVKCIPMTRQISFSTDEFYHIYNRGTEKRLIFARQRDYERFMALLHACNQSQRIEIDFRGPTSEIFRPIKLPLVDVAAYCLMPNHFHLLVREKEPGNISKYMQKVSTGYTMYFNKLYERTGVLFQGKFKAEHVDNDVYLKHLVGYIHLNPIKLIEPTWQETRIKNQKAAEKYLDQYSHSSYLDYTGAARPQSAIVNKNALLDYYDLPIDFRSNMRAWLRERSH